MCFEPHEVWVALGAVAVLGPGLTSQAADTAAALVSMAGGGEIERIELVLTAEQRRWASQLARSEVTALSFPYVIRRDGEVRAVAWFDTHRVRSLKETLLVAVGVDGRLQRVQVVAFAEPRRYLPGERFYDGFGGWALRDDLVVGRAVDGVSGATLTVRATLAASRRALALFAILEETGELARLQARFPAAQRAAAAEARIALQRLAGKRWPQARLEPSSVLIDSARLRRLRERSGHDYREGLVARYQVFVDGEPVAVAMTDTHGAGAADTFASLLWLQPIDSSAIEQMVGAADRQAARRRLDALAEELLRPR